MNPAFKRRRMRIGALTLALAALFMLAAVRLSMLVLVDGPRLNSMARNEHTSPLTLASPRGPIVDRDGKPLALSADTQSVYANPRVLMANSTGVERAMLAEALGIAPADLEKRLRRRASFVWLARQLPSEQALAALDLKLDGVGAIGEYKRFYPESNLASAVLGMAGMDGQGLSGVELQYDQLLRGRRLDLRVYHDAFGHPILDSPMALKSVEPGARVELTIDSSIQAEAENYLATQVRASGARRGAAVVLDPFTGEVLALANVDAGRSRERERLHDTAVQDAYEPGSTMKGVLGAIALEDHVINTSREIYCENGEWIVGGRKIHDDSRHQWLNLGGIIEVSSNIGAAKIALALGARRFYQGLTAFGIGSRTGIDLPGEAAGLLRRPSSWREIELADHGFGQGIAVTPIQMAAAYAAIANGGVAMRPYVVKAAYDASGRELLAHTPQALRRAVSPDVAHQMNLLLRNVVNGRDGTGRLAQVDDFVVAGKTGTAQMVNPATGGYYQSRLVASFVGFLPADDPRLVILVVLYDVAHGHFGGLVAAPVFSEIASGALRRLDIVPAHQPSYDTASMLPFGGSPADAPPGDGDAENSADGAGGYVRVALPGPSARGGAPDFRGLSLRDAFALARDHGLGLEVTGSGYVASQEPPPGAALNHGAVRIALSEDGIARPARGRAVIHSASKRRRGERKPAHVRGIR